MERDCAAPGYDQEVALNQVVTGRTAQGQRDEATPVHRAGTPGNDPGVTGGAFSKSFREVIVEDRGETDSYPVHEVLDLLPIPGGAMHSWMPFFLSCPHDS